MPQLERLRIDDFSDREFLLIVVDQAEDDGWTDSLHVAHALGFKEKGRRSVAGRFRWLFEYGAVEREHEMDENGNIRYYRDGKIRYTQRWRLTELGEAVAHGKLRKGEQSALNKMGDGQMIMAVRWLNERSTGDTGIAKLVQREWRYGHARRNGRR
jgi:hypothetical protein